MMVRVSQLDLAEVLAYVELASAPDDVGMLRRKQYRPAQLPLPHAALLLPVRLVVAAMPYSDYLKEQLLQ